MNIQCEKINRTLIVRLSGEIDHHYAEDIRDRIDREFERSNSKDILFDFQNVDFMDSSGIGMIIGRYKNTTARGGQVYAFGLQDATIRVFEISGLMKLIPCFKTQDEALNTLCGR